MATRPLGPRFTLAPLAVLAIAALVAPCTSAADWASRLGYPDGKKVVVLHAHDMGMCFETTQGCLQAAQAVESLSMSAMPPCPWFSHAASQAGDASAADVGLQLTLNSEWPDYRWRPASGADLSPSLVDGDGYLWRSVLQLALNADRADVQRELNWQLLACERRGLRPTHLTTHLGALYSRPDLAETYLDFARKNWLPAVVVELTPELVERLSSQGVPLPPQLADALKDYPLPMLRDLRIVPRTETYDAKRQAMLELIDALPAGLSQVAFSPAVDSPALRALTPQWEQYVWDAQLLQDEQVRARLSEEDVMLTNWVEIMQRFDN